ncbi:MAG: tRNA (N(6)-L-threonylcarbamoyladenosine(37)-C(2))-methylthiotransferase MtaB [Pseudomonadota bacterium]
MGKPDRQGDTRARPDAPAPVSVLTFGCRLNAYESEVMRANAAATADEPIVIVNTCAVTAEAERQARQAIRRARKNDPTARIVVTGCAAQIDPAAFAGLPEVDQVLGNADKLAPDAFLRRGEVNLVSDIMAVRETAPHFVEAFADRARAFVEVQNGCDHRCTFCIIPYGRGNSRSAPAGAVVEAVRRLAQGGHNEVVLTGVDLTSYGSDLPGQPTLGNLVQRILKLVPELPRLRLSSIDAIEIDETLFRLIAEEPRLMPHIHLSLQAGDDLILKRMKRRHGRSDAIQLCQRLRAERPQIALGADLIAGFPTETEAMFDQTLALVDECALAYLHVFPYSPRQGTPAARMPQVPKDQIRERARRLRAKGESALAGFLAGHVGTTAEILVENGRMGRLENFAPVDLAGDPEARQSPADIGRLVRVQLTGTNGKRLQGVPC